MPEVKLRWARSATKHGIRRAQIRYVVEHSGLRFRVPPPGAGGEERLVYVGDDEEGVPLEVMAIELQSGDLLVIHAMPLRAKYLPFYQEAKKWRV